MGCIVANTILNLYCGKLQQAGEVKCLEVALVLNENVYHGSVRDVGPSTNVTDPSTSDSSPFIS